MNDPHKKKCYRPAGSRISLSTVGERLLVDIPPAGWQPILASYSHQWGNDKFEWDSIFLIVFILSLGVAVVYPFLNISFGNFRLIVSSFCWVIVALFFPKRFLFCLVGHARLEVERQKFRLQWKCLGLRYQVQGQTKDINRLTLAWVKRIDEQFKDDVFLALVLTGTRKHYFGLFITPEEKEWLIQKVNPFLRRLHEQNEPN